MKKDSHKENIKDSKEKGPELNDCLSVMHPEMARNYDENAPCNDGTKPKIDEE